MSALAVCHIRPAPVPPPCRPRTRRARFRANRTALQRFAEKYRFDPRTGCVEWTGGTTSGQGKDALYGVFWFEGKRWAAHRWAAKFIHGLVIDDLDVDHECRNTLCVHHLQAITPEYNRELVWIRRQVGLEENPREPWIEPSDLDVPWFAAPAWLAPFMSPAPAEPPF